MMKKVALVTNVLDFAGPPAVSALLNDGFEVVAQDSAFENKQVADAYLETHQHSYPTALSTPDDLLEYVWGISGKLDVLISNDTYPAIHKSIAEANLQELQATLEAVLIYPFKLMQAAIPRLKAQASKSNIILITSCRTELPLPYGTIPDIARAGANALVKSLSLELAPMGIPVNAIAPNYLYSEAYFPKAKFIENPIGKKFIEDVVPVGRLGEPEELEELISYLANMKGSFHTGTIIKFAGGWPAAPQRPV